MEWLGMDTPIPLDKHRWIILYARKYHHAESLEKLLNSAGFEVTSVQEYGGDVPQLKGYKPFYGLIEPQITSMTPNMLKEQIYSPALMVSRDSVPEAMEIGLDTQELIFGDKVVPMRFLKDNEKALAGSWYMSSAVWSTQAPSIEAINKHIRRKGFQVYQPSTFPVSSNIESRQFFFTPGEKSPRLKDIRSLLGAEALYINTYPFEGDIDVYRNLEGKGTEMVKSLAAFGGQTIDVVKSVAEVGKQAGETLEDALSAVQIGLMVVVPAGLLGLGYWAYSKYQGGRA